jgi:hypothetical protein
MSGELTNYGTLLKKASTSIGELVSIDPPEYSNPAVEATNHSSAGVRQFVSSKLREMSEFKATINYKIADIALLVTDLVAGTSAAYTILYPDASSQRFNAIPTAIKPLTADAQKPDVMKAEITFRPTDSLDLSS